LYFSNGTLIINIINKHGKNVFDRDILCSNIDSNELISYMERYYINHFKCNRSIFKTGLNLTDGGEGFSGFKKSKKQCDDLSERIKDEYKRGIRKAPRAKKVHQYDIKTNKYLNTFENCIEAAIHIGKPIKSNSTIAYACRGKCKSSYGYIWSYEKMDIINKFAGAHNPVIQYDLNNNFIKEYKNCKLAAEENKFKSYSSIHNCAKGNSKSSYGFLWKFKKNNINT